MGIALPTPSKPVANYVPWIRSGQLVFVSGQLPMREGNLEFIGKIGSNLTVEEGVEAAQLCAINVLSQLRDACGGDLDRVKRIVKLTGFVNSAPEFHIQPAVVNGASDFLVKVFGEAGRHARSAVGCQLPLNAAVEIEAIAEIA
jgi:enamine deaminase RidA (YjgF/YER057c/UK114 family)